MSTRKPRRDRASRGEKITQRPGGASEAASARTEWPRLLGALAVLLAVTLAAYYPAWHGGMLWDDDAHLTRVDLRSLHGLWRIWFDVGATQQYYPVVHSAFWVMQRLWGTETLGYHLVNIGLHACSAWLVLVILRRLAVPGAALAALIFALHPLQVESVAWMTELKNTLSGALYLSAALAYLQFDRSRQRKWYGLALALFVLALLSKTVTATLPAALLVVFWWQRGRLRAREDAAPLLPFFMLGVGGGLVTAWLERTQIGAEGAAYQFTLVERALIAGRAIWFYLGKLVWPANLIFIYPRWHVSQGVWWQYLYPFAAAALLAGLFVWRKRSRGPLAAMLFFVGTLFPALGFFNVYPFMFSFVADHFQYLASLGIIALFSAGLARLARRWSPDLDLSLSGRLTAAGAATLLVVGAPLAALTWSQSREYADAETLYRRTLDRNPSCWLARNNLGLVIQNAALAGRGDAAAGAQGLPPEASRQLEEAIAQFEEALRLKPDLSQAHNNEGIALLALDRPAEAKSAFDAARQLKPGDADVHYNLALALERLGRPVEAAAEARATLALRPDHAGAQAILGNALQTLGQLDAAIAAYRESLRLNPDDAETHNNLGSALGRIGRLDEAVAEYQAALQRNPRSARAANNLGVALLRMGRPSEAAGRFEAAVRIEPAFAEAHYGLASALEGLGRHEDAVAEFREAIKDKPDFAEAHNDLGIALAELGRPQEAVAEFREALRIRPDFPDARANLVRALGGIR